MELRYHLNLCIYVIYRYYTRADGILIWCRWYTCFIEALVFKIDEFRHCIQGINNYRYTCMVVLLHCSSSSKCYLASLPSARSEQHHLLSSVLES
jgi:hypothetical protein